MPVQVSMEAEVVGPPGARVISSPLQEQNTLSHLPASASRAPGLMVCATQLFCFFLKIHSFHI